MQPRLFSLTSFLKFLALGWGYIEQKEVDPAVLSTAFMDFPDFGWKVK